MANVQFNSIFTINPDGSVVTNQPTRIGGIQLPRGFVITPGVAFNGIDITQYKDHELEVVEDNGVSVVTGIY
jgi:hypothetical protein